jgi:all-trans-retinol 13,14-reductase
MSGDYGTIPKHAPFTMHAALQNHFLKGVSYPIGGSSEIGFHIIPTITRAGGSVFVRAEVEKIITFEDGSMATGVQMKRDGKIISAPVIISNAGLYNTTERLLSPAAAPRLSGMMEHVQHGSGGLSVYVGLNGTAEELGIAGKHYWAMWTKEGQEDLDAIIEKYMDRTQAAAASGVVPMLFISFPSAKDPLWAEKHPGKSTATIVTFANYDWFKEVSLD